MIVTDKPPLNEELLIHFGVRGMKWGVRKDRATDALREKVGNTSTETKVKATVAVGAAAAVGVLYATGNLKAASTGTGRLALAGAKAGGNVLLKAGGLAVKGAFQGTKFVVGGAFKLTGKAFGGSFRAVFGSGRKASEAVVEKSGKRTLKSLLSFRRKGEGPASNVLKRSGKTRIRDLVSKVRKPGTTKLYPAQSILENRLGDRSRAKALSKLKSSTAKDVLGDADNDARSGLRDLMSKWRPRDEAG